MPWSLRKFLSKDQQQSSVTGGDKERSKEEKHSKLGKLRQQFSKGADPETVQTKAVFKSDNSNSETPTFLKESSNSNARRHDPVKGNDCDKKEDNRPFKSEEVYSADDAKSANSNESDFRDQNLTCYLENAIMESANSTLDRSARLNQQFNNSSDKIFPKDNDKVGRVDTENLQNGKDVSSSEPPCDTAKGLFVEYVNYDLLNAAEGSNGSSEYYSSDNEDNPKANSNNNNSYNRQGIIGTDQGPRLSVKENSKVAGPMLRCRNQAENSPKLSQTEEEPRSGNSFSRNDQRNNHLARKSSEEESRPTNAAKRTAADGKSQNATRPCSDETVKYSIDHHSVFAAALSVVGEGYVEDNSEIIPGNEDYKRTVQELGTKGLRVNTQHDVQCPLRTGIKDLNPDITDMEKARSIFGMCLCQNGEKVDNVTELDFRNCNLKQVPSDIFQYASTLTRLQLDSNTLSELPKSLFSCENIEYLTVSDNDLGSLPPTLAGLSSLTYLDISKNVIEDVPDCIRCCKNLHVLDASVNPIERLTEGFTQLIGLRELYLNDCFLEFLPASFGRLVQLTVLELRDNQLQILPKSIRRLGLLKRLDLGGNIFQEWPDVVCDLRKLTELWLDGNELSRVPLELGELTSLVYLDLSRNFIEAIPNQIGSLCELADLLLCENHISMLPETIGFLEKLTMIKVSMNQLTSIPESIGKLRAVEELDLSHNKLEFIPPSIGNLRDMHTLLLDNNMLSSIPPELGRCCKINVLQLSRNLLQSIPAEIGDLSQLRVLNICRNKLEHLPINIIKLAQLEALWVSSNQSKPNVPLHAELGPDGKTRILTNVLFPQREHETSQDRSKTDGDGYANDAADDDEPEILRRQRGITRVAFNLEPVHRSDDEDIILTEDDDMSFDDTSPLKDVNSNDKRRGDVNSADHHAVDVSADVISSNGNGPTAQASLMVKTLSDSDSVMNGDLGLKTDNEASLEVSVSPASYEKVSLGDLDCKNPKLLQDAGNSRMTKPVLTTSSESEQEKSDLNPVISTTVSETRTEDPTQPIKIRTWSSHSHLPSIPQTDNSDDVRPVAVEIIGKDDRSSLSSSPSSGPEITGDAASQAPISSMSFDDLPPPPVEILNPVQKNQTPKVKQSDNRLSKEAKLSAEEIKPGFEAMNIPFMDNDAAINKDQEFPLSAMKSKKTKPPVPPRIDSVLTKDMKPNSAASYQKEVVKSAVSLSGVTGLKIFTPALLQNRSSKPNEMNWSNDNSVQDVFLLPSEELEASGDGLAATDKDSGVGNDVDSQESIPECADEQDEMMMLSPTSSSSHDFSKNASSGSLSSKPQTPTKPANIKSVANIRVGDSKTQKLVEKKLPNYAPVILPTPASPCPDTTVPNAIPNSKPELQNSNKVTQSIKMFESISSPERKPTPASKSLVDLLPSRPRKTEEKAIIRPNNHLNGFTDEKVVPEVTHEKSVSHISKIPDTSDLIMEAEADQVMFVQSDNLYGDSFTFSKVGGSLEPGSFGDAETGSGQNSPSKRKPRTSSKSKFDETLESVKQNQFRERLDKIMQQQRNVAQASRVAQSGAALNLSRKSSLPLLPQQNLLPGSPNYHSDHTDSAFETITADSTNLEPMSPTDAKQRIGKKQSIHERMKNKLERNDKKPHQPAILKSNSSSRVSRTRPGSAPAAQLLQRRGSSQRNSIAAPESGFEEKRTLAPLYNTNERTGLDARARSKSIEQQLGQLLLDSDEEQQNFNDRTKYGRSNTDIVRRDRRIEKTGTTIRSSRNSLCSPPPVRHNMYAKARSSKNSAPAPLADWKHKLLQHIERKRVEKNQINTLQNAGRNRTQPQQYSQSIGHIKSPPRTSGPPSRPHQPHPANFYSEKENSNYVTLSPPQLRPEIHHVPRNMTKCVTAPTLGAATRTMANNQQYVDIYNMHMGDNTHFIRGQYESSKRSSNPNRMAKQRTFTPGPESFANTQPVAPRPKSAMEKFSSPPQEPMYAEPPVYRQNQQSSYHKEHRGNAPPLPSYDAYLQRRANLAPFVVENHQSQRLIRADPVRRSHRAVSSNRGNYEDLAGFPLRHSGSHESLIDPTRFERKPNYFREQPIRNASSHDSVLDQPLYRQQPLHSPTYIDPYYSSPPHNYPANVPQRYPVVHPVVENHKRSKYNTPDYATYVNVYDYEQSPVDYRKQSGGEYRSPPGYMTRNPRDPHVQLNSAPVYKHEHSNYKNYSKVPQDYRHVTDSRQQQPYNGHQYRHREGLSPTLYRPLAEREDGSVASAFKPYNQIQHQHKGHAHHHQHMAYHSPQYGLPPNNVISPTDYKGQRTLPSVQYHQRGGYIHEQPRLNQLNDWNEMSEDVEVVTVNIRRNPTFGFHVMGGVGAGGNPYRAQDDGVFITHVTPGGAADGKLQAGDKILLVNGSDFVGISHQRAVDLLRNAGQVAVLVVQRLLGKPV